MRPLPGALWHTAARALSALRVLPPGPPAPPEQPEAKSRCQSRSPKNSRLRAVVERQLEGVREFWDSSALGPWAERYLGCGLPESGFARFRCEKCRATVQVPFSCKTRLAQYLVRPWMAESRMVADDAPCERVIFRARGKKDRQTGRRPPIKRSMPAAEFVAKLLVQIPPKGQKLVNYYGLYSNRVRGVVKAFY